jgi:hypothetical protein
VHFFGYFLCASKESDPSARMADGTSQDASAKTDPTPMRKTKTNQ